MKIAVIGSNSFSGSHCVDYFLEKYNFDIIGISRSKEYRTFSLPYLYKKKRSEKFTFHQLDINKDLDKITELLDSEKPEAIINFAAQGSVQFSWRNPQQWFKTNCLGIVNLTNHLKDKNYLKKYVQISTPEVYGPCTDFKEHLNYFNPSTPYAASKAAGDLHLLTLLNTYSFPVDFIRSANVYGKHQQLYRIIPRSIIYLKQGRKIPLQGGGKVKRAFIHIRDVIEGIDKVISRQDTGNVYHFTAEKPVPIADIVKKVCQKTNHVFEDCTEIVEDRVGNDSVYELNSDETKKKIGWNSRIDLSTGVNEVIEWIEESWEDIKRSPLEYIHQE